MKKFAFFFLNSSGFGFRILCYRILKSEVELLLRISLNPVRSYFLGFHDVRRNSCNPDFMMSGNMISEILHFNRIS